MTQQLPTITVDTIVRGMSTAVEDDYEEYLACTSDRDFFFRIHEKKREEGNEFFVIGVVIRDRNPARWIDFPSWLKLE